MDDIREGLGRKTMKVEEKEVLDAYEIFFEAFKMKKEDFYNFGLEHTIFLPDNLVKEYWENLKKRVLENEEVYIRGYGRDAHGTKLYLELHKKLFQNEKVNKDPTNNTRPQKIVQQLTGRRRKKDLLNYQVSHIFGMTRNALMFEAPWNIALVPKIIDPFTGHESNGPYAKEYQELFLKTVREKYQDYISEYNEIIEQYECHKKIIDFVQNDAKLIISDYSTESKQKKLLTAFENDFKLL